MHAHRAEVDAIADSAEPPTFDNTIAALDRSGRDLERIERLFFNLTASETSAELQAIERDISPRLAAHHSAIDMDANLFARIEAAPRAARRASPLDAEQLRLLERIHLDFVREGARLPASAKTRYAAIVERLASSRRDSCRTCWPTKRPTACRSPTSAISRGCPTTFGRQRARPRKERGVDTPGIITLSRSLIVPFLTFSDRRDLREQAYKAWTTRGEHDGAHDNRPIAREILALRNEQARLHGYRNYAEYALDDRMAGTPDAVARLLGQVWEPAKARAAAERDALAALAEGAGATHADRALGLALLRRKSAQGALPAGRCVS